MLLKGEKAIPAGHRFFLLEIKQIWKQRKRDIKSNLMLMLLFGFNASFKWRVEQGHRPLILFVWVSKALLKNIGHVGLPEACFVTKQLAIFVVVLFLSSEILQY